MCLHDVPFVCESPFYLLFNISFFLLHSLSLGLVICLDRLEKEYMFNTLSIICT